MVISALLLGLFAVVGTTLVALTYDATEETIAEMEKQFLLQSLHVIVQPSEHDNDLFNDTIQVTHQALLGTDKPVDVYRARRNGKNIAAILTPVAPHGYSGDIRLLVGIYYNGEIAGVRVLSHRETPGLGDGIETRRSNWILDFDGRSLENLDLKHWAVKKDGGSFDQFTGATITPRAIVQAVNKTLQYFKQHKAILFAPANHQEPVYG
ncbi:MAG: electron transport complex subunit RsxG [Gammaproteobacteria bacterium]|nr:electron transport complex subunit RsxG [Gammaproteobacteria bacterium]